MSDHPVLRSRTTPATAPVPASEADAQLSVELRLAQFLAKAGDAVPKSYRGNPGAVWLAMEWANRRDMDVMTAMQNVSFYEGKPLVDATMQRSLAIQAGYEIDIEGDNTSATVTVTKPGDTKKHSATFTIKEAEAAGLTRKPVWKSYAADMLVARATTRALRRHAPSVVSGLRDPDEATDVDPVAALTQNAGEGEEPEPPTLTQETEEAAAPSATPLAEGPDPSPATDDIAEGEVVDESITDETRGKVLASISAAKASGEWKDRAQAIQEAGIPPVAKQMTEAEGVRALAILEGAES